MESSIKSEESRIRRRLARAGYRLEKSRVRKPHLNDQGGYQVINPWTNTVMAGDRYDLDLAGAASFAP